MSIVQRTYSAAVQSAHATHHQSTRSSQASAAVDGRPAGAGPGFTAAPWEGLYFEIDEGRDRAADDGRWL